MPRITLSVFDPNITENSPAGSCLLTMLEAASTEYDLELFTVRTDLKAAQNLTIRRMPVPARPVFLQSIVFTICSILFNLFAARGKTRIRISTQGGFPLCDVSYAHCCHKLILRDYRMQVSGGLLTRTARLLNHRWSSLMEAVAFHRARVVVVPSQGLANELTSAYGSMIAGKLQVIGNPIDCKSFVCNEAPTPDQAFTFAFCALGNFEWKGLTLILHALATGMSANLIVIGGIASEITRYRKLAQSLGLAERITFTGHQKDIRPYLWRAQAFVLPSVHETFSLVCHQAAAAGLPLIATDLHGLDQLLKPGVSGWRIERTVESLSSAMREAVADKARTASMGREAQLLVQQLDKPVFRQRWLSLLASISEQPTGPRLQRG